MGRQIAFAYRENTSLLQQLDPVTKFVGVVALTFFAFGTYLYWAQIVLAVIIFSLATIFGQISISDIWRATWYFALACLGFLIIQSLSLPGHHPWFYLYGRQFYLDTENFAFSLAMRIYLIFLLSFIFVRSTNPRDLAVGSVQILRVPYRIGYSLFVALRVIPLIEDQLKTVQAAQMVRGVGADPGLRGRLKNSMRYTVPVLVGVMRECNVMVHSMESRAFGAYPTRTFVNDVRMNRTGIAICVLLVLFVVTWYTLIGMGIISTGFAYTY
jgi:energy-coupling factor transport system permease protein